MATYKVNKGTPVAFRDGAYPTAYPSPHEGELFYNGSTGAFQFIGLGVGAWSSGGALNTGRNSMGGSGSQTASVCFGGISPARKAQTETYNGTAWTEVNDMNSARSMASSGQSQTAALGFAGNVSDPSPKCALTELWDGSSWTEVADLNIARNNTGGFGTSTAGLCVAGGVPAPIANVEEWNGTSWSEIADINTARNNGGTMGVVYTAGLYAGGPPNRAVTETWNGTSWTEVADLNTGRTGIKGFGSSTSGVLGGGDPFTASTEIWDGTSWSEGDDYAAAGAQRSCGNGASSISGFQAGGQVSGNNASTATEEWDFAHSVKTIDVS